MSDTTLKLELREQQAWIWLARPDCHNALSPELIAELTHTLHALAANAEVRVIILAGQGKNFCAGADLNWMKQAGTLSEQQNQADAWQLAALFDAIVQSSKPVIARVHGAALGGGMGLVAACDIAVASHDARFALSEVRLGLIPAVISPYLTAAIGARQACRLSLTAESIDAQTALALGLAHILSPVAELDATLARITGQIVLGGPNAQSEAKRLFRAASPALSSVNDNAQLIARLRSQPEAQEGLAAFLAKRAPSWQKG